MVEPYEQHVILTYLLRLATDSRLSPQGLGELCEFFQRNLAYLGLDRNDEEFLDHLMRFQEILDEKKGMRGAFRHVAGVIDKRLRQRLDDLKGAEPGPLETNLTILADELELDRDERGFFGLFVRFLTHAGFQRIFNEMTREHLGLLDTCAICLDTDRNALGDRLRPGAPLLASGVIRQACRTGNDLDDQFEMPDAVRTAMQKACGVKEDIRRYILGETAQASLLWEDFDYLNDIPERLERFLKTSIDHRVPGVNVLLWGPPGTGKTEFCKTLAQRLEVKLYAVGEQDEDGGEPTRKERMGSLQLAQCLLRYQSRSLLLFDEMDDLFEGSALVRFFGGKLSMGSKVFTNRLFENNPIPTIWTINDARLLDESIIRRMALAIEMSIPPAKTRERVWQRVLSKNTLSLPDDDIRILSQLDISPAVVDNAARVAKQIGGRIEDFQFATQGIVKAMSGHLPKPKASVATPFCPELIRTESDLERITRQLKLTGRKDFSLCLYGPPGTGKSAFVRHLAETLDLPVVMKRASDLFDAYVGETEKSIAKAFQEALDKGAFLVFDEADSLLGDRRYAVRNWEVSQVNEMLTWMENHPLPFACTTNLMDRLDQASLRRFTFKCHFDYLGEEQLCLAFERFFGMSATVRQLDGLIGLTPGDFALVDKKARIIGGEGDRNLLIDMLKQELAAKEHRPGRSMGFARE